MNDDTAKTGQTDEAGNRGGEQSPGDRAAEPLDDLAGVPGAAQSVTFGSVFQELGPAGWLGVVWMLLPAAAGFTLLGNLGTASDFFAGLGAWGLVVYVVFFAVTSGLGMLPTYAQAILGGWVFGSVLGLPGALAGFVGGAVIGYFTARLVSRDRVERTLNHHPRARIVRDALVGRGFWRTLGTVTLLRIPPNSPFALTNLAMSGVGVKLPAYVIGTAFGMLPRTAIAVGAAAAGAAEARRAGGEGGPSLQDLLTKSPVVAIAGIVVFVVVIAVLGVIGERAVKMATGTHTPADAQRGSEDEQS